MISIIIVNHNTWEHLRRCLLSIQPFLEETPIEVIVIDNGSKDGSPDLLRRHFPKASLVENTENKGFAAACNQGVRKSRGRFLLFLNSDTELLPNSLAPLIHHLETHPQTGIVGPTEQFANGTPYPSICPFPDLWFVFSSHTRIRHVFYRHQWANPYRRLWEDALKTGQSVSVDWISGATLMVRKTMLDVIGCFDEDYFFYTEETDLCTRARKMGWTVELVPAAQIIHHGGGSSGTIVEGLLPLSAVLSELHYFRKHRHPTELYALRILYLIFHTAKFLFLPSRKNQRWAYLKILKASITANPGGNRQMIRDAMARKR